MPDHVASTILAAGLPDEAILVLDSGGRVLTANVATNAVFGSKPVLDEADLLSRLDADPALALAPLLVGTRTPVRLHNGAHERWVAITVHVLPDAGATGPVRIVVGRDVTAERERVRVRDAFAGIVSHELRTPITTIYGGAQLLADRAVSNGTRREAASAVADEAERLYRRVEDLVVLARFDQPLAPGDEPVLVQRFAGALIREEGARAGVDLGPVIADDLPAVIGRQDYIEQVLRHLVVAALRHSLEPRDVGVEVAVTTGQVEVRVLDSGPPLTDEEAERLFDLFHRSSRSLADASGANITLFVCGRLAEAMGGSVWARTRDDGMTELGLRLRIARDAD